ncbi:hypothetical protein [Parasphingopyxis lamellibrachiae]|uniref:Uncharacterized protein n=1 Tax=Parasphingopyxis lamellibrachiae TaxID=680125 RepID=A0A3D9FGT2_9SPHN|nr:hypothetical protein [Parasphingopyxis lamellibrachiae]RED16848.1 hypothetical protein DFR46_1880 [Parasphingopyxis lamellibrachiae]
MKSIITRGAAALLLVTAMPAYAGTIAACITEVEDRDGVRSFTDYAVARSEASMADTGPLREAARNELRSRNNADGRIVCHTHNGPGHYVIVAGGLELNGRLRHLIGIGFGNDRAEALSRSDDRLNDVIEYNTFSRSGGELTVIEEGAVGS